MVQLATTPLLPVLDGTPAWTLETLWRMDWKRFQELVSLVLARGGFDSEVAWIRPDGTTVLAVTTRGKRKAGEALVQCAGWNGYDVGAPSLLEFYKSVLSQGAQRGIYVTPGRFDQNAQIFARTKNLELIDGAEFLRTIHRMSVEEQQMYLRMALVGSWDSPTCPSCNRKLVLREITFPSGDDQRELRDITFKENQHVSTQLYCRHLVVKEGVDVLFLKGVEAETMQIDGRVMGNMVCRGKLIVSAGACVSGLMAARSIKLEPGGLLEAEARILNADEIQPVRPQPRQWIWQCAAGRCKGSLPARK
jgi:hypothetical protein